ncbi:hypothetical protein PF001_g20667 [Phytophthora fragariae]|uniref:Uncharacterized protein n=1 Tax=Phytophthora fragariae TaxID=53985 RepID=A0A6A3FKH4_9STRA|nr:hypothetical protein PF009_g5816 [Phytophthora fragariae]KAE9195229.1 hypothetical protein PF004_g20488 [Phytophthora fragariae]KAE9288121.1 hypothetical protein PF001_g20667 [Phytophthora fragariae]
MSCFEIRHKHGKNGSLIIQSRNKRKIRARKPKKRTDGDGSDGGSSSQSSIEGGSDSAAQHKRARGADDN